MASHCSPCSLLRRKQPVALRCGPRGIVPSFVDAGLAARALSHAQRYARWRETPAGAVIQAGDVDTDRARGVVQAFLAEHPEGGWLDPERSAQLLESYRIPLVRRPPSGVKRSRLLKHSVGRWHSCVLADHTRPTSAAVRPACQKAVRQAYEEMAERFPDKLTGVLVQPMAEAGVELLAGIRRRCLRADGRP
jgi:acyl-CoA synthetase (NDP forming)